MSYSSNANTIPYPPPYKSPESWVTVNELSVNIDPSLSLESIQPSLIAKQKTFPLGPVYSLPVLTVAINCNAPDLKNDPSLSTATALSPNGKAALSPDCKAPTVGEDALDVFNV